MNWTCLLLATLTSSALAQSLIPGVYSECTKPGQFALTFDDGPSPFTAQLLQTLDEERVAATFFVLGAQIAIPELQDSLKTAYNRGHQIALHTYTHANLSSLSTDQVRDEMVRSDDIIRQVLGASPYYMRPPFGEVTEDTMSVLKDELDYAVVQWSLDSNDWRLTDKPKQFKKVTQAFTSRLGSANATRANSSFISLQHDILEYSVNQTRRIIQEIRGKGFDLVTVSQCLGSPKPQYRNAPDSVPNYGQNGSAVAKPDPKANPLPNPLDTVAHHGNSKVHAKSSATTASPWMTMPLAATTILVVTSTFSHLF